MSDEEYISGLTDNYIRVQTKVSSKAKVNQIANVKLLSSDSGIMTGSTL